MEKIRFGVSGLGFMGCIHALNLLRQPHLCLAAVEDPDPGKHTSLAKEAEGLGLSLKGVKQFTGKDGSDLLDHPDLDAVVLSLPTPLHAPATLRALDKGLHVLCEKPMALDLRSANEMVESARTRKLLLMVAHCLRFWPEYMALRNLVAEGRLGRLLSLNMWRLSAKPAWSWNDWLLDPDQSGGPMVDLHIHDVDFALFLLGEPKSIFATSRSTGAFAGADIIHSMLLYDRGPQVHLHGGWCPGPVPFHAGYEAWFERGFLRYSPGNDRPLLLYEEAREPCPPEGLPSGDAYVEELLYFAGCVQRNEAPGHCTPESSLASLQWVLACARAAEMEEKKNKVDPQAARQGEK